jgi:hypothetical protein
MILGALHTTASVERTRDSSKLIGWAKVDGQPFLSKLIQSLQFVY